MKKKIFTTRYIAGVGILTAFEIVFYIIGSFISFGGVNINLALVPIAFGAIMYGPLCGAFLGLVNGVAVLLTPATQAFLAVSVFGTLFICLLKCTVAGLASGFIYKLLKKHEIVATVAASLIVPIINTGIYILGCLIFFEGVFQDLILIVLTANFLIELGSTALLTPAIIRIIHVVKSRSKESATIVEEEPNEEK